ncbi:MAG: SpoIIE family protein phosphatase [Chloroflexi bacterium]|nr:SpoIIE family protein phosphatase [Chloroflexota bacterium]
MRPESVPSGAHERLRVAAATRPYPGESTNGDAWSVAWHGDVCRIGVVDGLGHGPAAAAAAAAAVGALEAVPGMDVVEAIRVCHEALRGTRGAAISIAQIDTAARRLTYAGVGNVEARLWQEGRQQRPISFRGIAGVALPTFRPVAFDLSPAWLLVLHTDGISVRFDLKALATLAPWLPSGLSSATPHAAPAPDPRAIAGEILERWARPADDATVVVATSEA